MKTLGILGGVGPETTSKVYLSLVDLVREKGMPTYPPILVYNMPFPFVIEDEAIVQGKNAEKMLPYLIEGARILERGGAEFGILPCNTLHKYIDEIRTSVHYPFLSILEEVTSVLKERKVKRIGILATETTIRTKIYEEILNENSIVTVYPTDEEQQVINQIIVEVLNGKRNAEQTEMIETICTRLKKDGAESILLACTDLQLVIADNMKRFDSVIDTTDILIQATLRELLKK